MDTKLLTINGLLGLGIAGLISYLIFKWLAKKPDKLYLIEKMMLKVSR